MIIELPKRFVYRKDRGRVQYPLGASLVNSIIDDNCISKRPGFRGFVDLTTRGNGVDGVFWWADESALIAVAGGKTYKVTASNGSFADVTGTNTGTMQIGVPVSFAAGYAIDSGQTKNCLAMANGGKIVTLLGGSAARTLDMADAIAPTAVTQVVFQDGYLLANDVGTNTIWFSNPGDMLTWTSAGYFQAMTKADPVTALTITNREIRPIGNSTIESWYNDGVTPFSRIDVGCADIGFIAPYTIANYEGVLFGLTNKNQIVAIENRVVTIISEDVDELIHDLVTVNDAIGSCFAIGKKSYYMITYPTYDLTLVFDIYNKCWYQWGYHNDDGTIGQMQFRHYAYCPDWNFHIVGDITDGKIYQLDLDIRTDGINANEITSVLTLGNINHGTPKTKQCKEFTISMVRGDIIQSGNNTRAQQLQIRWADDNRTFGQPVNVDMGYIGETDTIIRRLRGMGTYINRQYEITHSEPANFILMGFDETVEATR